MVSFLQRKIDRLLSSPFLFLSLLVIVYFFPIFFLNHVFYVGDILTIYLPFKKFLFRNLSQGIFPLWNPNVFSGYPFFADMTLGTYYLPSFILFLFPSIRGVSFLVVFHFFIAAYFMYKLGKLLRLSNMAALLASTTYTFSGLMINYIADPQRFFVVALYPLFFFTLVKALDKQRILWIVISSFALSLQFFAGHIQYVFIELIAAPLIIFLFHERSSSIHRLLTLVKIVFLGVIFSGIAIFPTLFFFPFTTRMETYKDVSIHQSFSLHPLTPIRFLIAHFWGVRNEGSAWGTIDTSTIGYLGFFPLILIILNLKKLVRRKDTLTLLIISLFSLFISLGTYLPFFKFFVNVVPLFKFFRNPMVFLALYTFCTALLGGFTFELFVLDKHTKKKFGLFFLINFLLASFLYFLVLINKGLPYFLLTFIAMIIHKNLSAFHTAEIDFLIACFILVNVIVVGLLGILGVWFKRKKVWLFVAFADLFLFTRSNFYTIENNFLKGQNPTVSFLEKNLGSYRYLSSSEVAPFSGMNDYYGAVAFQPPFAKEGERLDKTKLKEKFFHELELLPPNFSSFHRLSTINGYTSFVLKKYNGLFQKSATFSPLYQQVAKYNPLLLETKGDARLSKIDLSKTSFNDEILDQLAVKYIVTDRDLGLSHHRLVFHNQRISVYENTKVQPRVVILDEEDKVIETPLIIKETANNLEIKTQGKGRLVLRDVYYPGWRAYVDGQEVPIQIYDNIFRSIEIPKERGTILFCFYPSIFYYSAIVSGVSFSFALVYLIFQKLKKIKDDHKLRSQS